MKTLYKSISLLLIWMMLASPFSFVWASAQKVGALGRLQPSNGIVDVSIPPGQTLVSVFVKNGDQIKKGEKLLAIQDFSLTGFDEELAELELKEARATKQKAIDIQKIDVEIARMGYEHVTAALRRLLDGGKETYSTQAREDSEYAVRIAKAKLDAALEQQNRQEIERASRVAMAQVKLKAAQKKLQPTIITAPVDGTVLEVLQKIGQVGTRNAALKIANLHEMDAIIEVFEGDILKLSPGLKATVTSKSLPEPISGKIVSIGRIIDTQSRNSKVVVRLDETNIAAQLINLEVNVSIELP